MTVQKPLKSGGICLIVEKVAKKDNNSIKWRIFSPEAQFKEKHGVWDPMPELTTTDLIL
jgi:hypothetical protein